MGRLLLVLGALYGALAVLAGAYGAHALGSLPAPQAATFQTAVLYHLAHAVTLLLIAVLALQRPTARLIAWAGLAMLLGITLFSGTLYIGVVTGYRGLSPLAPFGGMTLLLGWLLLAVAALLLPARDAA